MLQYDRIDMSEGIDVKKPMVFMSVLFVLFVYYQYFIEMSFRFQPNVCDIYHDLTQNSMSVNDIAVVPVEGNDHENHFWYMGKD